MALSANAGSLNLKTAVTLLLPAWCLLTEEVASMVALLKFSALSNMQVLCGDQSWFFPNIVLPLRTSSQPVSLISCTPSYTSTRMLLNSELTLTVWPLLVNLVAVFNVVELLVNLSLEEKLAKFALYSCMSPNSLLIASRLKRRIRRKKSKV